MSALLWIVNPSIKLSMARLSYTRDRASVPYSWTTVAHHTPLPPPPTTTPGLSGLSLGDVGPPSSPPPLLRMFAEVSGCYACTPWSSRLPGVANSVANCIHITSILTSMVAHCLVFICDRPVPTGGLYASPTQPRQGGFEFLENAGFGIKYISWNEMRCELSGSSSMFLD